MPKEQADLDECPVPDCPYDITIALVSTDPVRLKTQNLVHDAVCLEPTTHDDEAAFYVIYHNETTPTETDPELAGKSDESDDEEPEPDPDPPEEERPDPSDLEGPPRIVLNQIVSETATGGTIKLSGIAGKCINADIPPSEVEKIVDDLAQDGYVDEISGDEYKAV